jgi:hypothetical protein
MKTALGHVAIGCKIRPFELTTDTDLIIFTTRETKVG